MESKVDNKTNSDPDLRVSRGKFQRKTKTYGDGKLPRGKKWGDVVSIYGNKYPNSTADDWVERHPLGWVHRLETSMANGDIVLCSISDNWRWHIDTLDFLVKRPGPLKHGEKYYSNNPDYSAWKYTSISKSLLSAGCGSGMRYSHYSLRYINILLSESFSYIDSRGVQQLASLVHLELNDGAFRKYEDGNYYHSDTFVTVDGCSEKVPTGFMCNNDGFTRCRDCARWVMVTGPEPVYCYCTQCREASKYKNVIKEYSCKQYPDPIVSGEKPEDIESIRLYGVEVEAEVERVDENESFSSLVAHETIEALGSDFVFTKRDGSIGYGFEIVTAPADLQAHRSRWPRITSAANYKRLRAWDTDRCGMHVHVSRSVFSALEIGRLLYFMGSGGNRKFLQKIAGRPSEHYCSYTPKPISSGAKKDSNRYCALNTANEKTIEFRIFRSTVNPRHIIRNIEFVDALCQFVKPCMYSLRDLKDPSAFLIFCAVNRKQWPELTRWMALPNVAMIQPLPNRQHDQETVPEAELVSPKSVNWLSDLVTT